MHGASVGKFAGRSTANENLRDYVYYVRRDELYFGACHQTGVLIFLRVFTSLITCLPMTTRWPRLYLLVTTK